MATGYDFRQCSWTISPNVRWTTLSLRIKQASSPDIRPRRGSSSLSSVSPRCHPFIRAASGNEFLFNTRDWPTLPLSQLPHIPRVSPICHHFKTTQICKQLRKYAHTQQKKRKKKNPKHFLSTALFLFSSLLCSAKKWRYEEKNHNEKNNK